jgi:hypothetical protein
VNVVINFQVAKNAGRLLGSCTYGDLSRTAQLYEVSYGCETCSVVQIQILDSTVNEAIKYGKYYIVNIITILTSHKFVQLDQEE